MFKRLLIANRAEIAIRIARTAQELGIQTVALYSTDDARSLHAAYTDEAVELPGSGVSAYLSIDSIIAAAVKTKCDALHPGYGLLSESADLAQACADKGIIFIGPSVATLQSFGDKISARALARDAKVPVIEGTDQVSSAADIKRFFELQNSSPIMVKAVNGGGGRGMRIVSEAADIQAAFNRCQAESLSAFGSDQLYVERFLPWVRHIEVQIVGDGDHVIHLWERDCSIQRRNQKLIELAPAPNLHPEVRQQLLDAAITIGEACQYKGLGTVEFLLEVDPEGRAEEYFFIETNPRIQVEHTVTEEVTGLDLVELQLRIAAGETLSTMELDQDNIPLPKGFALQARINTESLNSQGELVPAGGTLQALQLPGGPGIRVDTYAYAGYATNPNFDSLLAKLIVHNRSQDLSQLLKKAERALSEVLITGVDVNVDFLRRLLKLPELQQWQLSVRGIEKQLKVLLQQDGHRLTKKRYLDPVTDPSPISAKAEIECPPDMVPIRTPLQSVLVSVEVELDQTVMVGQELAVVEAMKMQHVITAACSGAITEIMVKPGDTLDPQQVILLMREDGKGESVTPKLSLDKQDLGHIRPDLAEVLTRQQCILDSARPEAVAKRHQRGQRTARENICDLVDTDSFREYGGLAIAAQRARLSLKELIEKTPADGLITGVASVNGQWFPPEKSRCMVISYDATVYAGTQGYAGHKKKDRMFDMAREQQLPVIFFAEGGGGRPGDTEGSIIVETQSFLKYAELSGKVPTIGITTRYCFAGNAALLGCSDVIIATRNACIGMAGPSMIEGGGLGSFNATDIGPIEIQAPNGSVDIVVEDEAEAVAVAKQYLSYFQGPISDWQCDDQRKLRHIIPEHRSRTYDIHALIEILADTDSVLELRKAYGLGIVTCLIRIEGQPFGLMANNNQHMGGAIESPAADKAARFMRLCNAYDIPLINLMDTPGFMVGPEAEKTAQVRRFSRMFVTAAACDIPCFTVIIRKGYGLGSLGMTAGSFHRVVFSVAWPTGEFGGMGLEGAVKLGHSKELEAEPNPEQRQKLYDKLLAQYTETGKAINIASHIEIDNVIDPLETRRWLVEGLSSPKNIAGEGNRKMTFIDTW